MLLKMAADRGLGTGLIESTVQQMREGGTLGWGEECGLLGGSLDQYAVQKGGDRRESISKWCKSSSSGEGETSWD